MRRVAAALLLAFVLLPVGRDVRADQGTVEGRVTVNALEVTLSLAPPHAKAGQVALAAAQVRNNGAGTLSGLTVSLRLAPVARPPELVGRPAESILTGGEGTSQTWRVCVDAPGQYMVMVTATALDAEGREMRAESEARLLTIQPGKGRCGQGR